MKKYLLIFGSTLLLTFICFFNTINVYANEKDAVTATDIILKQGEVDKDKDKDKDKDNMYKPKDPEYIKKLPQTGEIISSFIFIMIGFSIILFISLLLIDKYTYLNEWRYC